MYNKYILSNKFSWRKGDHKLSARLTSYVNIVLVVACCILAFSAVLDLSLWFLIKYMIPSWTVSVFCSGFILFLLVFMHFLEKGKAERVSS